MPDLDARGVLARVDADLLTRYAATEALWRDGLRRLVAEGPTVSDGREGTRANPTARLVRQYATDLLAMGRELGLTPAARTRLPTATPEEHDWWDELLDGPRPDRRPRGRPAALPDRMTPDEARALVERDLAEWHGPPDLAATLRRLEAALAAIPRAERPLWGRCLIARETERLRREIAEAEAILAARRLLRPHGPPDT